MLYLVKVQAVRVMRKIKNKDIVIRFFKTYDIKYIYVRRRIKEIITYEKYNESL